MASVNFEFIKAHNSQLWQLGLLAEQLLYVDAGSSLIRLRGFGEEVTKTIYSEKKLIQPYQSNFVDLVRDSAFQQSVSSQLVIRLEYLRKEGNKPAHGDIGSFKTAMVALGQAFELACYLAVAFYGYTAETLPKFEDIPKPEHNKTADKELKAALDAKAKEVENLQDQLDAERAKQERFAADIATLKAAQASSQQTVATLAWDEAQTRKLMIDSMLNQANWTISNTEQVGVEIAVDHQPTQSGKGAADYVLWGEDGKPLAVIEAKRTSVNPNEGREQARIYADGLEKMHGQRPVIFYTNGYETYIWDDVNYNAPRLVYGFYSRDSLQYMIYQRQYRQPNIQNQNPDLTITDRGYQIEAIKTVLSEFEPLIPAIEIQDKYVFIASSINKLKDKYLMENLAIFESLSQKAFSGELEW